MARLGISTWSIHRALEGKSVEGKALDLLDVPTMLRDRRLTDLQICHFHLPSREDEYLARLRARIEGSGIRLDALLLDFGDLSHPVEGDRDAEAMIEWLDVASKLGATHARISAGHAAPTQETLARVARHLLRLAEVGDRLGVKVITENWHAMVPTAAAALRLIALTDGRVPLCLDFGNWSGAEKYEQLAAIAPHAVTVHAKCGYAAAHEPDAEDFQRCLQLLKNSGFDGTIALIYDGPCSDEWGHIAEVHALALEIFAG